MLTALIANIQDAIVLLDGTGKVIFESPSAAAILGVSPDDVMTAFGLGRIHPDERASVVESFERTRATPGAVFRGTYRFQRGDGRWRHLEALAKNLLDDPELRGVLITFRDVTNRILAVEAADRATAARDEFLSRMSHELRAPLHAVIGWAQLLECEERLEVRDAAGQIRAAGAHLLRLVEDALDLAAVQEGRVPVDLRPLSVPEVVAEAIDLVTPLAHRGGLAIHLGTSIVEPALVVADRDRLRQVLLNLLTNAVKYNQPNGEVEIGWTGGGEGRWRIFVRDTGPGIPRSKFDRLFERYDRLGAEASAIEGTGLGLAIARRLVELMGGTIGVESTPGSGSTFWVDLRAHPESPPSRHASPPLPRPVSLVTPPCAR